MTQKAEMIVPDKCFQQSVLQRSSLLGPFVSYKKIVVNKSLVLLAPKSGSQNKLFNNPSNEEHQQKGKAHYRWPPH